MVLQRASRSQWVDVAKGVGIVCVIVGHACTGLLHDLIYSFHMPLFFFLSGFVHSHAEDIVKIVGKRIVRLMVPYFLYSSLIIVVCNGFGRGWLSVISLRGVTPTWFLSCLFMIEMAVIICEYSRISVLAVCLGGCLATFLFCWNCESQILMYLGNVFMPALSFWCFGCLFKRLCICLRGGACI